MHFRVVVEVNKNISVRAGLAIVGLPIVNQFSIVRLSAFAPLFDSLRPPIERAVVISADVKLFRAVEPDINEVGGQIFSIRKFAGAVGDDKSDILFPQ